MKKTIVPQKYKRSLEVIMRDNPNMKAMDILAEQEFDNACYDLWLKEYHKENLAIIKKLEEIKYFKIRYNGNSKLMIVLEIISSYLSGNEILFDAITTRISKRSVVGVVGETNGINIESLHKEEYQQYSNYFIGGEVIELEKKEYDAIIQYIDGIY